MKLNLSEYKDPSMVEDGEHVLTVVEAKFKIAKTGARMVEAQFKTESGARVFQSFVTVKGDGTVNQAGWSQLISFLKKSESGFTEFEDDNTDHLMQMSGLSCKALIKNELDSFSGSNRPRIKKFV